MRSVHESDETDLHGISVPAAKKEFKSHLKLVSLSLCHCKVGLNRRHF